MTVKRQVKSDASRIAILLAEASLTGLLKRVVLAAVIYTAMPGFAMAAADDPQEILRKTRINQASGHQALEGRVREGETVIPFRLLLEGDEIKYEFSNPEQTLVLQLREKDSRLVELTRNGSENVVTEGRYDQPVHGTKISYEDLSMRFLYWPTARIVGEEVMVTQNCWILSVEPASMKDSQYGSAKLWIQKRSGALVRVETYDRNRNLVKRLEVTEVQKVEGGYILKQMRIQRMEHGKPGDAAPTYLEIQNPEKAIKR